MTLKRIYTLAVALVAGGMCCISASALRVDELGVSVRSSSTREFSYSDKAAGFYYGMTGTNNWDNWFAGWNIQAHRIFSDYQLSVDGKVFDKTKAITTVFPDHLFRSYNGMKETFRLVDGEKVIFIDLKSKGAEKIDIELLGGITSAPTADGSASAVCSTLQFEGKVVRIAPLDDSASIAIDGNTITTDASAGGFIITFGTDAESAKLITDSRANKARWIAERKARMQQLLDNNSLNTNSYDSELEKAIAWIELTADELVTRQHGGWGIYAGLPWFTDFWGRDMFIAMPGSVLCTGQFEVAKNILLSFAKYQDLDPKSPTYGRVPNRLNLEGILYNTTDGTPRFVMQIFDYLKYTGDRAFVKSIYKNVKIATDASLDHFVDDSGYLTHADADTWMDAKRQSKYPCSPRGNRAVDIQALWYKQLTCAVSLADFMGKKADAKRWREAADKLKGNFERDFIHDGIITDHLNADGSRDTQLRPNTMYAYDLVSSDSVKMHDIRTTWEHLVYPWGVSSLDQMDENFHPYHEQWHRYHKDDAYHNGTIWLWQNGMAMQRMIEYGQEHLAFRLFRNMNRQAFHQGAVGSLAENADAWCLPGKTWVRRTGTFLQSWSNSEQIRTWNQYFLGVRPDMLNDEITIAPRISDLKEVEASMRIADGSLCYERRINRDVAFYSFSWSGSKAVTLNLDIEKITNFTIKLAKGDYVEIDLNTLEATTHAADGSVKATTALSYDEAKKELQAQRRKFFNGTDFAEPCYRENLKSMSRYFDPPLDYYSVE